MKYFLRSFSSLLLNHSRRVVVSYKRKFVHEVLVNCLFKLAQEKVWLGELTIAVDLGRKAKNKQNSLQTHKSRVAPIVKLIKLKIISKLTRKKGQL